MSECLHEETIEFCVACGCEGRVVQRVPMDELSLLVEAVAQEALIEPGPERVVTEVAIANAARALVAALPPGWRS